VSSGGYSVIYGGIELAPSVGLPVSLNYNGNDYDLVIASYAPGGGTGVGGSAATLTASAAPTTTISAPRR
jgi:hypothetical protein